MKQFSLSVIFLSFVFGLATCKINLGDLTTLCSKSDPKLDQCIVSSTQQILPALSAGIKEIGLPPIDPLQVAFMALNQVDSPVGGLKLNITDATHNGLANTKVLNARVDPRKKRLELEGVVPVYNLVGQYNAGGRILLLPIVGHGPCNITAINLKMKLTIDSKLITKNNEKYCIVDKLSVKLISLKRAYFSLEGLFNGNKNLGDTMNRFLTENSLEVFKELKPTMEVALGHMMESLVSHIFDNIPCTQMYLP